MTSLCTTISLQSDKAQVTYHEFKVFCAQHEVAVSHATLTLMREKLAASPNERNKFIQRIQEGRRGATLSQ